MNYFLVYTYFRHCISQCYVTHTYTNKLLVYLTFKLNYAVSPASPPGNFICSVLNVALQLVSWLLCRVLRYEVKARMRWLQNGRLLSLEPPAVS